MSVDPDAVPATDVVRIQVVVAARGGCRAGVAEVLAAVAERAVTTVDARVVVLTQLDDDPFPLAHPLARPYDAVLELQAPAGSDPVVVTDRLAATLAGIADALRPVAHRDLSGVLVGAPQEIVPTDLTPVRYQYFMRRRAGTTHAAYIDHYFHHHAQFGVVTPGIEGYTQFHVDPAATTVVANRLGLGAVGCDSVSELHLESVATFTTAIAESGFGMEAVVDEETFVDRANSVSITSASRVVAG